MLVGADLSAGGLATPVQAWGLPGIGVRMPIMMGVTFAAVTPMIAMGVSPDIGLTGLCGAVIAAGLFAFVAAPPVGRLPPLFPPGGHRHLADARRRELGGRRPRHDRRRHRQHLPLHLVLAEHRPRRRHGRAHPRAVDFAPNRNDLFVAAVSVGFGMITLGAPNFFERMPHAVHPPLESGILHCVIAAVVPNLFSNGRQSAEDAREAA